jgi:peptide/nickel transport system permease protein
LAVSVLIFAGTQILPGDVATTILGQSATPQALANMREDLGLNRLPMSGISAGLAAPDRRSRHRLSSRQELPAADWQAAVEHAVPRFLGGDRFHTAGHHPRPARRALPQRLGRTRSSPAWRWLDSLPEFFVGYLLIYFFAVKWQMAFPASPPSMTACRSANG